MGLDMYLKARQSLYVSEYFGKEFAPAVERVKPSLPTYFLDQDVILPNEQAAIVVKVYETDRWLYDVLASTSDNDLVVIHGLEEQELRARFSAYSASNQN